VTLPKTVAELDYGARTRLRVSLIDRAGTPLFDLRLLEPFGGPAGAFAPTKTGLSISISALPELAKAIVVAEAQARALGLIGGAS
jgi:hypothetical protein